MTDQPVVTYGGDPAAPPPVEAEAPIRTAAPAGPPVAAGNSAAPSIEAFDFDYSTEPLQLSELGDLRDEVLAEIHRPPLRIRVPERAGNWVLECTVELDDKVFSRFQKMADRKGNKRARGEAIDLNDVSEARLSALLLGHYNAAIYRGGRKLLDVDGDPITFRSREWHQLVGVNPGDPTPAATAAVRMYGGDDGLLVQAGRALMRKSGWLDTAAEVDDDDELPAEVGPTGRS